MLSKFTFGFGERVPGLVVVVPNLAVVEEVSKSLHCPCHGSDDAQHTTDDVSL